MILRERRGIIRSKIRTKTTTPTTGSVHIKIA